jgi:hypothetical protein
VLVGYEEWLDRQALSSASRRAYLRAVRAFVAFLATGDVRGDPLGDRLAGAHALRDFKRGRLRARAAPATVNLELAAIDTLYRSRGIEGVASLTGGTVGDRELAEAGNVDLVAIGEMSGDQLEELLDRELGIVRVEAALG